jgi:hypothetical protein
VLFALSNLHITPGGRRDLVYAAMVFGTPETIMSANALTTIDKIPFPPQMSSLG